MPRAPQLTGRLKTSVEQLRDASLRLLEDRPAVELLLHEAAERAREDARLGGSYEPLHRLVKAHITGAYTQADPEDVAWALAAVMYVASAWDLAPDYLPDGLADDRMVAEGVSEEISEPLRLFALWERMEAKRRRARPDLA